MTEQQGLQKPAKTAKKEMEHSNERDVFREVPLRYLGYANEFGEAFRHMVPLRIVHLSYAVSTSYVVAHAASQGYKTHTLHHHHHPHSLHHPHKPHTPSVAVLDTLLWQGLASIIIPGLTINRVCAVSRVLLHRYGAALLSRQLRKWAVTVIGLSSIPVIIHPIDWTVDRCMDYFVRPIIDKVS